MGARARPAVALGAVALVAVAVLARSGVPTSDLVRWVALVAAGVLVPGVVVVRAVRGAQGAAEDLTWGMPVGLVLALLTWAVGLVLGSPVAPVWTGVFALALLLNPTIRRRVFARGRPRWGTGSGMVVVSALVLTPAWAWGSVLASLPLNPERPFFWAPDVMFHVALTGEMARTAAPVYPMVPEGTYPYHWFFHALAAHLGQGMQPLPVVTHLLPLTLLLSVVGMAATAARVVSRHPWGAAAGAVAVGAVGMTAPSAWVVFSGITARADTDGAGIDPIRLYWEHSASTTLGWLAALGVVAAAAPVLRHGPSRRRGDLALLGLMAVLAAGAKSSQTPVLLAGVGAVIVLGLVRTRWRLVRRAAVVGAVVVVPWVVALLTMYAGGSQGLVLGPGARVVALVARTTPALVQVAPEGGRSTTVAVGTALTLVWLFPLLPRLLGLLWWVRRPVDPMGLLCGATVVAGLAGTLLTTHPGRSEIFFLVSAYPVGVVGSAAGVVLAVQRLQERWGGRRVAIACALGAVAGAVVTGLLAAWAGSVSPVDTWRAERPGEVPGSWLSARQQVLAWAAPTLALVAIAAVATVAVVVLGGRPTAAGMRRRASGVLVVLLAALAGAGLVTTVRDVGSGRPAQVSARIDAVVTRNPERSRLLVSPTLRAAAELVRTSGSPWDVVVTNRACLQTASALVGRTCDPRDFVVSALTGRRTGVSGWAYAPTSLARAAHVPGGYARMPFWDPARLAEQRALVEQPTAARVADAWARGERWVLADRAAGPVSPALASFGEVLVDRDGIVLVRLRSPAGAGRDG